MRTLGLIEPQMLIIAAFSQHVEILNWAQSSLNEAFGPIACEGPTIQFVQTRYYERTMGTNLKKRFLAFTYLVEHDQLAAIKRKTIEIEKELIGTNSFPQERPLNLDPGFLSLGKFVLAT